MSGRTLAITQRPDRTTNHFNLGKSCANNRTSYIPARMSAQRQQSFQQSRPAFSGGGMHGGGGRRP